jgi:16S rRNA (adenine1518-N6/adenine1519-N6)-dimethyltransferase
MRNLLGAVEIRSLAQALNLKPTNKLGKNFVVDANTCRKIVKLAEVNSSDVALEIGPGLGTLTSELLKRAEKVIAVEFDGELARKLPGQFPGKNLEIINEDILKFDCLYVRQITFLLKVM